MRLALLTSLALLAATAHADEALAPATAAFATPTRLSVTDTMDFGLVAAPRAGHGPCRYTIAPLSRAGVAEGGTQCAFLRGDPIAARLDLECAPGRDVHIEVVHTDTAPAGAAFAAIDRGVSIDDATAGPADQTIPCDTDGRSVIRIGARLDVTSAAQDGFRGQVGTIVVRADY